MNNRNFFGMGEEPVFSKVDAEVAAFDAAQKAAPAAEPSLLSKIIGGVQSAISSDTFKALAPVIGAAVATKVGQAQAKTVKTKAAKPAPTPAALPVPAAPAPKAGMPGWVIPVGIAAVAAIGIGIYLKAGRKGRK